MNPKESVPSVPPPDQTRLKGLSGLLWPSTIEHSFCPLLVVPAKTRVLKNTTTIESPCLPFQTINAAQYS